MPFGLTLSGFNPARLEDVRQAIVDDLVAAFGQNIRTDSDSVFGQLIGIFAERYADLWEHSEDVYSSAYLGSAQGQSLDDLVALAGISRLGATFSVATLTLSGTPATIIPAGSVVRDPVTLTRWVTSALATIGGGGTIDVLASPETTGAIVALSGTLTEIVTPVTGWASVSNALDADVGRSAESDSDLRARFILSFRIGGGSSDEAIRAVLLSIDGVTECSVVSNRSDMVDADGRPPHSFEAIVRGGADQDIFDAIWVAQPAGIQSYGFNTNGTTLDSLGGVQAVGFTRPVVVPIYIRVLYEFDVEAGVIDEQNIEDAARDEILAFGSSFQTGQDVIPFKFIQHIETDGFLSMTFNVGTIAVPTFDDPLVLSARQLADFDSSRVAFVRTN